MRRRQPEVKGEIFDELRRCGGDGIPERNLATFVATLMEPEARYAIE